MGSGRQSCRLPRLALSAGGAQYPFADGNDQAGFFSQGDEFGGRNHPQFRMLPAQQCFHPAYLAGDEVHLRLIIQLQFLTLQCVVQRVVQNQVLQCLGIHLGGVKLVGITTHVLAAVQRDGGIFQQTVRGKLIQWVDRDADAGGKE